jgi:hypothetical protein
MSIVVQFTPTSTSTSNPTVQDIVTEVSQDIRRLLSDSGADATILLNYVNRVQLDICRASRWNFLLSTPQRFVTALEQTNYWLGATGSAVAGSVDTGLNLTDLDYIQENSVLDRTNNRRLAKVPFSPNLLSVQYADATQRKSNPLQYRHDRQDNVGVMNLFPAPDNQCGYQMVPGAPVCGTVVSGALTARTYFVKISWLDSKGNEGLASDEAKIFVPTNSVLSIGSPLLPLARTAELVGFPSYRVYVGATSNGETLQATVSYGSSWQEPNSGLVVGAALPSSSALDVTGGYVIEFRYYKVRPQLATLSDHLLIPWEYKDVVIAGTNALASQYLKLVDDTKFWSSLYQAGVQGMLRDKNLFPKSSNDFIRPDQA